MLVEILSVSIKKGIVEIQALDVSEENLARMERMRDDMNNPEITFLLDTREEQDFGRACPPLLSKMNM